MRTLSSQKKTLFKYLLFLTLLFVALEMSFFRQTSELYLGDIKLVASHLHIPALVLPGIAFYFSVLVLLHIAFTFLIWAITLLISIALSLEWKTAEKLSFVLWFVGIGMLLLFNQCEFPNSKFAEITGVLLSTAVAKLLLIGLSVVMLLAIAIAAKGLLRVMSLRLQLLSLGIALTFIAGLAFQHSRNIAPFDGASVVHPNIIVIGIDSLRPDALGYFGFEKRTPHFDDFLNHATVFSDAITPIARTFPAWVSILTGQYPKHNGVRFNLPNLHAAGLNTDTLLPEMMRRQGYQTIFATDETRFSNIDDYFGFEKVVTPPIGMNDFLLGSLNDFPMTNVLMNTPIGRHLFPYSYGNRAAYITYDPDSFLTLLDSALSSPRQKPLFLVTHFCLPHFPYVWGQYYIAGKKSVDNYYAAVRRVDQQFSDFLALLKRKNLLENTIVVLLSDHGEAVELVGDRVTNKELFIAGKQNKAKVVPKFYPPSLDKEEVNQSAGHGTDVLGLTQYHSVLAFRMYGIKKNQVTVVPNTVSLLDIKPTLLELIHHPIRDDSDGRSLASFILGEAFTLPEQHLFIESDFSPQAVRSVHPETRKLLFVGMEYFQIDSATARIQVKPSMGNLIVSSKQLADIYQGWILALYPQSNAQRVPILVNLYTGEWTDDLTTDFAKQSPAQSMLAALQKFYQGEVGGLKN